MLKTMGRAMLLVAAAASLPSQQADLKDRIPRNKDDHRRFYQQETR
jgi:hypothetical protein